MTQLTHKSISDMLDDNPFVPVKVLSTDGCDGFSGDIYDTESINGITHYVVMSTDRDSVVAIEHLVLADDECNVE